MRLALILADCVPALRAAVVCFVTMCLASVADAGLSGPPESYVKATADGQHMLVMLSSTPVADDRGDSCTLPDGQQVRLRETFPVSGLYGVGSTTPIWQADWYGRRGYVELSDDGRYAVCVNLFGDGAYMRGGPLSWGVMFYDRGVEIKSHDVADLIDYPSLMEFTTSDYHYCWMDDSAPEELNGKFFDLTTSTRARFRFDITTGEIVEEHRFWRWAGRYAIASILVIAPFGAVSLIRRLRVEQHIPGEAHAMSDERGKAGGRENRHSFSLRVLFFVMTTAAIFCWIPHVATFVLSAVIAFGVTRWAKRRRRTVAYVGWSATRRLSLFAASCFPWIVCYVLSAGPATSLMQYFRLPHDVRAVVAQVVYAPLLWLFRTGAIENLAPLRWYFEGWH
jgi:hypothetical protein